MPYRKRARHFAALLSLCFLIPPAPATGAERQATATRLSGPHRLDGHLDEADWARALPIGNLAQSEPQEGAAPSEATEVRVLVGPDALYIGVVCHDRDPAGIVTTQLARDADLEVDDRIVFVIDPFLDHRNGFFFEVNAAGARADGQIANNSQDRERSWDGIWDVRARLTDEGWTAEIVIPFKTLRFRPGQTTWGFNVERQIKRLEETDRWASPSRDVWISNMAAAGELTGLDDIRQGRGLDVRPFVSGGENDSDAEGKIGLDLTKALTSNLTAALTVNTDFAETEADERQVNLTRFPLFLPEKRAFFLEGAGIYGIAGLSSESDGLIPFFSRRIGLSETSDTVVPILAGAKVAGRMGNVNAGFLDVRTRSVDNLGLEAQNLLAARVSRNLFRQSWIGAIATRGNPDGGGENDLMGADARFATSDFRGGQNLSLDLFVLRTHDAALGSDHAFGFKVDYPNDRWDCSMRFKQIGDDFKAALGFVPRTGIRKLDAGCAFQPRPERLGIRQLVFEVEPEIVTDLKGEVQDWKVLTTFLNARMDSGDEFQAAWAPSFERLTEPFEVQPGVVIPQGAYHYQRIEAEITSATKRPWVVELAADAGGFYDGNLWHVSAQVSVKPNRHVLVSASADRSSASLPAGDFVTHIFSGRVDYNASPNLAWSSLVQYDSESQLLGVQSRLRFTLKPGNDLFVVLNRGWLHENGRYQRTFDRGSAKLQYTFRL